MKLKLQDNLSSVEDLKEAIGQIRKYAQWFSQTAVKMQRSTKKDTYVPPDISPAAVDLIKQWHGQNQASTKSLDELIASLEDFVNSAPTITITLASPVPGSLKKTLVAWCRQNIEPSILIDFQFNSAMLGGMVVRYGSHIYDWSFRRHILDACPKFPEVLRHV